MNCNPAGIALLKEIEGYRSRAYLDTGGVWTIGYGHTRGVYQGMECTREQAEAWLREDLSDAEEAIDRLVEYELESNEFSALCSFVYNIGTGNFSKSAVLRCLNNGDFDEVPDHMRAWKYDNKKIIHGLEVRREKEIALWNTPEPDPENDDPLLAA